MAQLAAFVSLVAAAAVLLPLSALVVEALSERAENWILVLQLVLVTALGTAAGGYLPGLGPAGWSRRRRIAVWAGLALVAAAIADGIWLLLLAG